MTTLKELAEELGTTVADLREFNPENFAIAPCPDDDSEISDDAAAATREAWQHRDEAEKVTAEGLDAAGLIDGQ